MPPPRQKHFSFALKSLFSGKPLRSHEEEGRTYTKVMDRVYPGQERYVTLSCGRVCVAEKGHGDTILLVHGLGAHIGRWNQTIEALSHNYHVVAYDHPGFGKSDKGHKEYSVRFYSQIVRELIEKLGLKNVTLVGHSLGGAVVLRYLVEDPGPVTRAAVVTPAGIRLPQHRIIRSLAGFLLRSPLARNMLARSMERCTVQRTEAVLDMIFHAKRLPDDPEWRLIRHTLQDTAYHLMHFSIYGQLSVIRTPLLVVWGENDTLLPADLALMIHKEIPLARLALIPDCGHYPMLERPDVFHHHLCDFLGENKYIESCEH
jgi:pimeloyl-ACP methyl ester carboxylesterase